MHSKDPDKFRTLQKCRRKPCQFKLNKWYGCECISVYDSRTDAAGAGADDDDDDGRRRCDCSSCPPDIRVRVQLIGHLFPCMTEIYLHIVAHMADYMATHPYYPMRLPMPTAKR